MRCFILNRTIEWARHSRVARAHVVLPRTIPLVLILVVLGVLPACPTTLQVPSEFSTIQSAIDSAQHGDTVLVAPGYYVENISFRQKEIVVSSHFLIDNDPRTIFETIIDGSNPNHPDSATTVRILGGPGTSPVIQGFTITGGTGTRVLDPYEGIYYRHGGGIVTDNCSVIIQYNYVHSNGIGYAGSLGGGGIHIQRGAPVVANNVVANNWSQYGSGINISYANIIVRNNVVARNFGGDRWSGSGIYQFRNTMLCENNTVVYNQSALQGGGIKIASGYATLRNNIVWYNEAPSDAQIYLLNATATVEYSNVQDGWPGTENIDADPLLSEGLIYTLEGSPCVDAGDTAVALYDLPSPSAPDAAKWPSRGGLRNDIGAYGGPGAFPFEIVGIICNPDVGWAPMEVVFSAESWFDFARCTWNFGDGASDSGRNVAHIYSGGGVFDVSATVEYDGDQQIVQHRDSLIVVLADSLIGDQIETHNTNSVEVVVNAVTSIPLRQIYLPFTYDGELSLGLDSFSTVGCRTDYFEGQDYIHFWPTGRQCTIRLVAAEGGGAPDMAAGSGPIVKLYFTHDGPIEYDQSMAITMGQYGLYEFAFSGPILTYTPETVDATITYVTCCVGATGNVDGDPDDMVDIGDLTRLIDYMFISFDALDCREEANVNGIGGVDMGDLTKLIDYLFISYVPLAECM
ncbi:MAG: PKD domain-containing protein [Candidatus Zixiibacteriota bacterium]|nr:MAG: PKD domain-containing protein [candidate division Zixibacteria bacterium]